MVKPYVDTCSELRSKSIDDFDKKIFKLLLNSVYGKTMKFKEEKHVNFEFIVDAKRASKKGHHQIL